MSPGKIALTIFVRSSRPSLTIFNVPAFPDNFCSCRPRSALPLPFLGATKDRDSDMAAGQVVADTQEMDMDQLKALCETLQMPELQEFCDLAQNFDISEICGEEDLMELCTLANAVVGNAGTLKGDTAAVHSKRPQEAPDAPPPKRHKPAPLSSAAVTPEPHAAVPTQTLMAPVATWEVTGSGAAVDNSVALALLRLALAEMPWHDPWLVEFMHSAVHGNRGCAEAERWMRRNRWDALWPTVLREVCFTALTPGSQGWF